MSSNSSQWDWIRTFVDELARRGLEHAFLAPGSRNTPLSVALARHPNVTVHVVVDERVAAYAALGVGKATGVPALVGCTSGTAAVNFHPAVVEADAACIPLIVVTADRPARLRNSGANQTINQVRLYGDAVRAESDVAVALAPVAEARASAARARRAAVYSRPGPVHWNLQFEEPLVPPADAPELDAPILTAPIEGPTRSAGIESRVVELPPATRPLIVAGWGAAVVDLPEGWPVLADPLSNLRRGANAVTTYEALARVPGFHTELRPDLIVRVGAIPTGKALHPWLDGSVPSLVVLPDDRPSDPFGTNPERVNARQAALLAGGPIDPQWMTRWRDLDSRARVVLDEVLDGWDTPFEGRVMRDLVAEAPNGSQVFVGSSMPVRDLEYFALARGEVHIDANRGASGIDGVMATGIGAALARPHVPTTIVLGDLSFLHDTNALLLRSTNVNAVIVVLDNDGGGIFEFLPPRDAVLAEFETLFGTPHGLNLVDVAAAHGVAARRAESHAELREALTDARSNGGLQVIVVPSDRRENRARHVATWEAVAQYVDLG